MKLAPYDNCNNAGDGHASHAADHRSVSGLQNSILSLTDVPRRDELMCFIMRRLDKSVAKERLIFFYFLKTSNGSLSAMTEETRREFTLLSGYNGPTSKGTGKSSDSPCSPDGMDSKMIITLDLATRKQRDFGPKSSRMAKERKWDCFRKRGEEPYVQAPR